jgi:hypothetical protein
MHSFKLHTSEYAHEFHLPHTVVFSRNFPVEWFHSGEDGKIFRQPSEATTLEHIIDAMCTSANDHAPRCDIIAQFVYSSEYVLKNQKYSVYLTRQGLEDFLHSVNNNFRAPKVFGVLQKFVDPGYPDYNILRRVVLTPIFSGMVSKFNLYYF